MAHLISPIGNARPSPAVSHPIMDLHPHLPSPKLLASTIALAGACLAFQSAPPATAPTPQSPAPASLPTRPPFVEDMLFTDVTVDGVPAGRWMIDTGAATSVISESSPAVARILKLPIGARAASPSGSKSVVLGLLPKVHFEGAPDLPTLGVIALDLRPAAEIMRLPLDGVLGVNALGPVYRLDFPNRRFLPSPFPDDTQGLVTETWVKGAERPTVLATLNGKPARLTLDSGKNRVLTVTRDWLSKNNVEFKEVQGGKGFDAAGVSTGKRTTLDSLSVLGITRTNLQADIAERTDGRSDGLIGVGLLRDAILEINAEKRTVRVLWRQPG